VWEDRLVELFLVREGQADAVTLAIFSERPPLLVQLTAGYFQVAVARGARVKLWQFLPGPPARNGKTALVRRLVVEPERFLRGAERLAARSAASTGSSAARSRTSCSSTSSTARSCIECSTKRPRSCCGGASGRCSTHEADHPPLRLAAPGPVHGPPAVFCRAD